jgi:heme-degrading monooxygenase HmoA
VLLHSNNTHLTGALPVFIAMNHFQVAPGRGSEFEDIWKSRETHLQGVPGFVRFALLRGDDEGEYISHSTWESREAFLGWAQSEAFRKAHGSGMPEGIVVGHPRARFYEAALWEEATSAARA